MNISNASSPRGLRIPQDTSPTNSANTANTITGRPPLWTNSSQRKVSRLYLYTTLPLSKIIEVVHAKSPDTAPGKESASKKLNALLDKEPRWLHPRTESDMVRRLNELSLSPTRSLSSRSSSPPPPTASDPPAYLNPDPNASMANNLLSPVAPLSQPFSPFSQPFSQSTHAPGFDPIFALNPAPTFTRPQPGLSERQSGAFSRFLRERTFMSTSTQDTQRTNGSIQRVLADYSEPYVRTVKKLIKRYTAPLNHRADSLSPVSDFDPFTSQASWINDPVAPPYLPGKPHLLPGEFICLEEALNRQAPCFPSEHQMRSCLCFARQEINENSLLLVLKQLYTNGPAGIDVTTRDHFNNTILHALAAEGNIDGLVEYIQSGACNDILSAPNTAGQTFLHILYSRYPLRQPSASSLLNLLSQMGFDFSTCDHYGRTVWNLMLANGMPHSQLNDILAGLYLPLNIPRDAFGVEHPSRRQPDPQIHGVQHSDQSDRDRDILNEAKLLQCVRQAGLYPDRRFEEGRNGLHCLAAATLSYSSLLRKYGFDNSPPPEKRRRNQEPRDLDSSTDKMSLRLQVLSGLLDAGVDPNHYDDNGNTPLMAFVAMLPEDDNYKLGPDMLAKLIKSGAKVNARNRRGETALHIAVRCGRKLAVRTLCDNDANVHVRDAAGRSLLEVADMKTKNCSGQHTKQYAHYEACRAWLSGRARAVQSPTLLQEWGLP
ncbi:ankyrin repeat-containing domain protein [Mariannaea sp. PMI_226]|nr:ankyrin repeat-containing domain protein [Mariannaea sp. PMI_226]